MHPGNPKNHAAFPDLVIWREGSTAAVPYPHPGPVPQGVLVGGGGLTVGNLPEITCVVAFKCQSVCITYWVTRPRETVGMGM